MKAPQISVIMLTYNREGFLSRMTDCVLAQTCLDFEFIIVDNGSTDKSGAIADSYAEKDSRICVIHKERGNIGSGRNAGLEAASGEWIAFVDDDDACEADYLSFLHTLAIENNAGVSICGATWADFDEKRVMNPEEALITLFKRKRYNVAFPTKLIRKNLFEKKPFPESGRYDDIYLLPKILAGAKTIAYHGISKYHFERHGKNNSNWTQNHSLINADILDEYLSVYRDRTEWLTKAYPGNVKAWNYFLWSFELSMLEKITRFKLADCYGIKEELADRLKACKAEFMSCENMLDFEKEWCEKLI